MEQAASDYVLAVRVLHTGSIIMTHAIAASLPDKAQRDTMQEAAAQVMRNGAQKLTEFS